MSLPGLLTAYAEYIADVLVNECGRPVPDRLLRYHTRAPDDLCSDAGSLAVWWDAGVPTNNFPQSAAGAAGPPCGVMPMYTLTARYVVCWPAPEDTGDPEQPVELLDTEWDATAAMLAGVADCVTRFLIRLGCTTSRNEPWSTPAGRALVAQCARQSFRFTSASPTIPGGTCAGVEWTCYAAPKAPAPVS